MYCMKCQKSIEERGGSQMVGCFHFLCTKCIVKAVKMTKVRGVQCVQVLEGGVQNCSGILEHEILEHMVPTKVYQAYLERTTVVIEEDEQEEEEEETTISHENDPEPEDLSSPSADFLSEDEKNTGWAHKASLIYSMVNSGRFTQSEAEIHVDTRISLLETRAQIDCPICMDDEVPAGNGVVLKDCLHMFCKECLAGHVEHSDEPEVKCPYIDGNYSCVDYLRPIEIRALVTPEVFDKHQEKSLKLGESSMENSFHCKTPDCRGWCVYDPGVEKFPCPICRAVNCIACQIIHEGTCADYKARIQNNKDEKLTEEAVEELIRSGEYMRCPQCKTPVKRMVGCDWIQCACRMEICWITRGPRWGPKGKGDWNGGCQCRRDGKTLCHPKCANCH